MAPARLGGARIWASMASKLQLWIDKQVAFRMGMGVDETGGDGQIGGVDPPGGGRR